MRIKINKYYGFVLPLGALIAVLVRRDVFLFMLALTVFFGQFFSLGASECFRVASAKLISQKKIHFSALLSMLMLLIGHVLLYFWMIFCYELADSPGSDWPLALTVMAFGINMLRLLEEKASAQSDSMSATMGDILSGILAATSVLMWTEPRSQGLMLIFGLAVLDLLMLVMTFRKSMPSPTPRVLTEIPRGLLRSLLFPLLYLILSFALLMESGYDVDGAPIAAGLFAGCIVLELSRSTLRRSETESHSMNALLASSMLLLAAVQCLLILLKVEAAQFTQFILCGIMIAGGSALLLYAKFTVRTLISALLLIASAGAALLLKDWQLVCTTMALPAAVCMVPDYIAVYRTLRVKRIRAKARKGRLQP